jgi:Polysaccharide lyase
MSHSPSRTRRLLTTSLLALAALGASAPTASARVLWSADAERPRLQEWANYSCQDGTRVRQVGAPSPVAQGNSAYEIEVRDGDDSYGERCELGQGNPTKNGFPLFQEGDERWISFQTYLPDDYPTNLKTWNVIMQLKQLHAFGTPAVSMEVRDGNFVLMNSDTNHESSGCNWWWEGPATKNRWVKFTLRVKFSPNANVGFIELYGDLDGRGVRQLMPRTYMHTMKVDNSGVTVPSHSRVGLYRNPAVEGTAHILFDGYTIGDDRASVEAAAFGAGSSVAPPPPADPPADPESGSDPQPESDDATTTDRSRDRSKRRRARIWLRVKGRRRASTAARRWSPWGRILRVYGGIRGAEGEKRRTVVIQLRRNGRWEWLTRGQLRRNGRFYLAPSVDMARGRVVKLRAVVRGVGHSGVLRARVR